MASPPTASEFLGEFPEFTGAPTPLVEKHIARAVERTNATTWGALWRQGVLYRTADLLAHSPYARPMKLVDKDGYTIYWRQLRTMMNRVASGMRAVKDPTEGLP